MKGAAAEVENVSKPGCTSFKIRWVQRLVVFLLLASHFDVVALGQWSDL